MHILQLLALALLLLSCEEQMPDATVFEAAERAEAAKVRILAIGNSFTDNATANIPEILNVVGVGNEVFFAKSVLGNSSLEQHWNNYLSDNRVYGFYYAENKEWQSASECSFDYALTFTDWDVIVIQQVSWLAGDTNSYYPYIDDIIQLVRSRNSHAAIGWQMTWAYAPFSSHPEFYRYGRSYSNMYEQVVAATYGIQSHVDFVIPSGCLIDRLRGSADDSAIYLTDGFHLRNGIGCFALSWLWQKEVVEPLTGYDSDKTVCADAAEICGVDREAANDIYDMITIINSK